MSDQPLKSTPEKNRQKSDELNSKKLSQKLSVIIFKDHLYPRVFHLPVNWINKLGILAITLLVITLVSNFFTYRYYHLLKNARTDFAKEIEESLKPKPPLSSDSSENKKSEASPNKADPTKPIESTPPIPSTESSSNKDNQSRFLGNLFSAFAPGIVKVTSDLSQSPISIENIKNEWRGNTLKVHFELHYTKDDGGNQKGRIYLLVRGQSIILTYPDDALESAGAPGLLNEKKGESFSVSRLRMVDAEFDFGTIKEEPKNIEVIINDLDQTLVIHQSLSIPAKQKLKQRSTETAPSTATPSNRQNHLENTSSTVQNTPATPAPSAPTPLESSKSH